MSSNPISHPDHYTWHPVTECHNVTQEFPANIAQAIKYLWRYERKGKPIQDLMKAIMFIEFEIERVSDALDKREASKLGGQTGSGGEQT